jgi:hypothetical protein
MPRFALAALPLAGLFLAAPALAANGNVPNAVNPYTHPDSRAIAIQNWTSSEITVAKVQTVPDGKTWELAHGGIPRNEASEIVVPARDCIANVWVKLKDGRVLQLAGLHDCRDTQIAVRNERIWIPQLAVPGAKQHGTPG